MQRVATDGSSHSRLIGYGLICLGLMGAVGVFYAVWGVFQYPGGAREAVAAWGQLVGGESLTWHANGESIRLDRPIGLMAMAVAMAVMGWISLGMLNAGLRCLIWMAASADQHALEVVPAHASAVTSQAA